MPRIIWLSERLCPEEARLTGGRVRMHAVAGCFCLAFAGRKIFTMYLQNGKLPEYANMAKMGNEGEYRETIWCKLPKKEKMTIF